MNQQIYDVFLSHGSQDVGLAKIVTDTFQEAGMGVFAVHNFAPGKDDELPIREALADCSAMVVLLTRSTANSPNVAFEVGAAFGWNKPIYVIFDGLSSNEVPEFLKSHHVYRLAQLPEVVRLIDREGKSLSDEDRLVLSSVYQQVGVTTDQLLLKPAKLRELTDSFNVRVKSGTTANRLMQELIRLRKRGVLPALPKRTRKSVRTNIQTT